jgi:hypothetical protein
METPIEQPPTLWCPSCGAEYRAGSLYCSDCRVALVRQKPDALVETDTADGDDDEIDDDLPPLVAIGDYPRLHTQILRRRLETANITTMVEWTGSTADAIGTILVPEDQAEFAAAVVNELDVDDEVPDTSPIAYVSRIEEHLAAAEALLEELRTTLEQLGH